MAIQPTYKSFLVADNTAPAIDAYNVTPTDNAALTGGPCRALYVGVTGNITIVTQNGNSVLFTGITAGSIIPVQAKYIQATGTTASGIVALY